MGTAGVAEVYGRGAPPPFPRQVARLGGGLWAASLPQCPARAVSCVWEPPLAPYSGSPSPIVC